jgi:nicotinate-nucleotide adenylyltransferase
MALAVPHHPQHSPTPLPDAALAARSILVYGGTFDPPHRAHVELPTLVRDRLGLELLLYIPASISPFKQDDEPTPGPHRLAMLDLALREQPRTAIWTVELDAPGVHYTVDTLALLRSRVGLDVPLHLLIGADHAREFHRWREPDRILDLCKPAVMMRPPDTRESLAEALKPHWDEQMCERWLAAIVDVPELDIAATEVRRRLATGEGTSDILANDVRAYISANELYRSAAD